MTEKAAEAGHLTPEQYIKNLENQVTKDKRLMSYFLDEKDAKKAELVHKRIKLMEAELKDEV